GVTHRRDCECVRCDAGYRPTEQERTLARKRIAAKKAREQAAHTLARKRELEVMKQAVMDLFVDEQVKAANDQLDSLREARARSASDARLAELCRALRARASAPA